MSLQLFFAYVVTWLLVALTPGPAVMCVMSHTTRFGVRRATLGILGIQLGHLVFFGCTALGLAALLKTATTTFAILRLIGALYLLYLGIKIIASTFRPRETTLAPREIPSDQHLLWQGFAIQVTNPKALLFMSALLPQFIRPEQSLLLQLPLLLVATILIDVSVLYGYARLAERGAKSIKSSRIAIWLERAFGTALVGFGCRLLGDLRK